MEPSRSHKTPQVDLEFSQVRHPALWRATRWTRITVEVPLPASPVRRPSLGLVDSSSFRTHGSDASPDQNLSVSPQPSPVYPTPEDAFLPSVAPAPQRPSHTPPRAQPTFPNALPAGPHRFIGVAPNEEAPAPSRGPSHRFISTTSAPAAPSSSAAPAEVPRERPTRPHSISTTTVPSTTVTEIVTEAPPSSTTHHYRIRGHSRTSATSTSAAPEEPAQVTQTTRSRGRGPQVRRVFTPFAV